MMRSKLKIVSIMVLMFFAISIVFTACADTSKDNANDGVKKITKIRYAHGFGPGSPGGDVAIEYLKEFAEANKDWLELAEEVVVGDEMKSKIRIDIAGNNLPDMFNYWGTPSDAGSFVESGLLLNIDEYFKETKAVKKDDYIEGAFNGFLHSGKHYGIPLNCFFVGFWFCNKDLFQKYNLEYPKTYEDLLAVSKVFNENGIVPLAMGSKGGNPGHFFMSELYTQFPNGLKELQDMANNWKFDTDNMHKVADLIADMRKNDVFPKDTIANGDWGPSYALYSEGKAAMVYSMSWMLQSMKEDIVAKTEIINAPKLPGATVDPATFISRGGSSGILINKKSWQDKDKRAAIVAVTDMTQSDDFVKDEFYIGGQLPGKKIDVDESKIIPILGRLLKFAEGRISMTNHWLSFPAAKPWADCQFYLDELMAGTMTPDDYIDKIQKSLDKAKSEQ